MTPQEWLDKAGWEFRQIASKFIEYAEDKYEINL